MPIETTASVAATPGHVTITSVTPDGCGRADISRSCGHSFQLVAAPERFPKVGDVETCATCRFEEHDRLYPPLPDDQIAAIGATLPACPRCGGQIDQIPFIKRTTHKLTVEIDGQDGSISAWSEDYDTQTENPDWEHGPDSYDTETRTERGTLDVQCAEGHHWKETRLAYRYDRLMSEHVWFVLPAMEDSKDAT